MLASGLNVWSSPADLPQPGLGAPFGFAGTGVGEALAVVSGSLADVGSSGEAAGSAVAPTEAGLLASPALEQAKPWPSPGYFWPVSVPQVKRLVASSRLCLAPPSRSELSLIQEGTSSNTPPRLATTEASSR